MDMEEYMAEPITCQTKLKEDSSNPDSEGYMPACMEQYIMRLQVRVVVATGKSLHFIFYVRYKTVRVALSEP